jgi:hypothetical protein
MGASKNKGDDDDAKREVVTQIAMAAGALERCELHGSYFDPMDDEALDRAENQAKEMMAAEDAAVAIFAGNEEEIVDLLQDVVADSPESCEECDGRDDDSEP